MTAQLFDLDERRQRAQVAEPWIEKIRQECGFTAPKKPAPTLTLENQKWWATLTRSERRFLAHSAKIAAKLADAEWLTLSPTERGRVMNAAQDAAAHFGDKRAALL